MNISIKPNCKSKIPKLFYQKKFWKSLSLWRKFIFSLFTRTLSKDQFQNDLRAQEVLTFNHEKAHCLNQKILKVRLSIGFLLILVRRLSRDNWLITLLMKFQRLNFDSQSLLSLIKIDVNFKRTSQLNPFKERKIQV